MTFTEKSDVLNILQCTHSIPHVLNHIIQGGSAAPRLIYRSNKKEDPQEIYATPDCLSTDCGLSQNLSLPCNTMLSIIPVNKYFTPLSRKLCTPVILKVNACCLTFSIIFCSIVSAFVCTLLV